MFNMNEWMCVNESRCEWIHANIQRVTQTQFGQKTCLRWPRHRKQDTAVAAWQQVCGANMAAGVKCDTCCSFISALISWLYSTLLSPFYSISGSVGQSPPPSPAQVTAQCMLGELAGVAESWRKDLSSADLPHSRGSLLPQSGLLRFPVNRKQHGG